MIEYIIPGCIILLAALDVWLSYRSEKHHKESHREMIETLERWIEKHDQEKNEGN